MIEFCHVTTGYGGAPAVRDISLCIPDESITAFIGPNGCGKTTLLRAAVRQLPLYGGEILLDGRPISSYGRKELARTVSFMPQVRAVPAITVQALVSHGRFPHLGLSRRLRGEDRAAIERAMEHTGVSAWAERELRELSGGERQRVYLAMVLAQETKVIFLDEPTTYLDLGRQFEVLELIRLLNAQGKTIVMVLHELALALQYSHRTALMENGRLVQCTGPRELYESGQLDRVFGVRTHRADDAWYFTPQSPPAKPAQPV